jgi:hypothetical protein
MPVSRGVIDGGIGTIILVVAALYFGIDPVSLASGLTMRIDPAVSWKRGIWKKRFAPRAPWGTTASNDSREALSYPTHLPMDPLISG